MKRFKIRNSIEYIAFRDNFLPQHVDVERMDVVTNEGHLPKNIYHFEISKERFPIMIILNEWDREMQIIFSEDLEPDVNEIPGLNAEMTAEDWSKRK